MMATFYMAVLLCPAAPPFREPIGGFMRLPKIAIIVVPLIAAACAVPGRPAGDREAAPPAGTRSSETVPEARIVEPATGRVRTGIDVLAAEGFTRLKGKRVGLVTSGSGVDGRLRFTADLIARAPGATLAALFAPEHGVRGALGAGAAVGDGRDPRTGVPVFR